jgi:hypothetical protein
MTKAVRLDDLAGDEHVVETAQVDEQVTDELSHV